MAIRDRMEQVRVERRRQAIVIGVVLGIVFFVALFVVARAVGSVMSSPREIGSFFGEVVKGFDEGRGQ